MNMQQYKISTPRIYIHAVLFSVTEVFQISGQSHVLFFYFFLTHSHSRKRTLFSATPSYYCCFLSHWHGLIHSSLFLISFHLIIIAFYQNAPIFCINLQNINQLRIVPIKKKLFITKGNLIQNKRNCLLNKLTNKRFIQIHPLEYLFSLMPRTMINVLFSLSFFNLINNPKWINTNALHKILDFILVNVIYHLKLGAESFLQVVWISETKLDDFYH